MLEMFIFETNQFTEQLEQIILDSEKSCGFDTASINEIFRIMHTIKGSAAMMLYNNISGLAHSMEDLFYVLREEKPRNVNYSGISDIVLEGVDFIKNEIAKLESGKPSTGDALALVEVIEAFVTKIKSCNDIAETPVNTAAEEQQKFYISPQALPITTANNTYEAVITFDEGCEMENIRAFSVVHSLKEKNVVLEFEPPDIIDNENSAGIIRQEGFRIVFRTNMTIEEARTLLINETLFLRELEINVVETPDEPVKKRKEIVLEDDLPEDLAVAGSVESEDAQPGSKQSFISVNILKLDRLLDLVGELVISEAMVLRNPEITVLQIESFQKAARQLEKITSELQDTVMSIRMVPLSTTFHKMNRIVRDMSKKLGKNVQLAIIGEETEVDKNIIEHISDPLMHLIRNAVDHGLETTEERLAAGKPETGTVTLEANNEGGDVWIIVRDDGRGLNRKTIIEKARESSLLKKNENELSEREVYSLILMPGFSTKERVTEFSGRGVGMDVVVRNIEKVGGQILIDSSPGTGSVISIKIPLTLAIINGMAVKVGKSSYVIPTTMIRESFRAREEDVIRDPDNNEMILIRGDCYPIIRLHKYYKKKEAVTNMQEGIIVMVENEFRGACLFADELLGEQQVVVKSLPRYIKKVKGIAGCTLLGDGSISLILDVANIINQGEDR
jgi:two-component system chemotaxis sensor kinase CheA